jgi:tetratricopeptide (TPR) repeat protein
VDPALAATCLDARLRTLEAFAGMLERADRALANDSVTAVTKLPSISACFDPAALRSEMPTPSDPELATKVTALETRAAELEVYRVSGRYRAGLEEGRALLNDTEALGFAPLNARVQAQVGLLETAAGDAKVGIDQLEAAFYGAVSADMELLAADAATDLAYAVGYGDSKPDQEAGRHWARMAEALLTAVHGDDRRPGLHINWGAVESAAGELDAARAHYTTTLELQTALTGEDHPLVATAINNIGHAYLEEGKLDEAQRELRRGLEIRERVVGPTHPHVAISLANLSKAARLHGQWDVARDHAARALGIWERALGADSLGLVWPLSYLGMAEVGAGRTAQAKRAFERMFEIGTAQDDASTMAQADEELGRIALSEGDPAMARLRLERAVARLREVGDDAHDDLVYPATPLARLLVDAGECKAAMATLSTIDDTERPDWLTAHADFDRARCGAEDGPARARAALESLRRAEPLRRGRIAEIERWLADHAGPSAPTP